MTKWAKWDCEFAEKVSFSCFSRQKTVLLNTMLHKSNLLLCFVKVIYYYVVPSSNSCNVKIVIHYFVIRM